MEARHIPSMLKASFIRPGHIHVLHTMQQNSVPEQIRFPYLFYPISCQVTFPSFIPFNLTYFTFSFCSLCKQMTFLVCKTDVSTVCHFCAILTV